MAMNGTVEPEDEARIESSLRASIKLNPSFAPSYSALGVFLGMRHRNLEEARMLALSAVQLEPENFSYRMNTANILMQMERGKDAATVIRNAMHLAKSPQETAMAETFLQHAEEYAQAQERARLYNEQVKAGTATAKATGTVPEAEGAATSQPEEPVPDGPHHFTVGVLKDVHCSAPAMDLNVVSAGKTLGLYARNYFKVRYSVLNVTVKGELNPCVDLEGRPAKVEYVESTNKRAAAVVAIEIHK
jgi:hypothetical protein